MHHPVVPVVDEVPAGDGGGPARRPAAEVVALALLPLPLRAWCGSPTMVVRRARRCRRRPGRRRGHLAGPPAQPRRAGRRDRRARVLVDRLVARGRPAGRPGSWRRRRRRPCPPAPWRTALARGDVLPSELRGERHDSEATPIARLAMVSSLCSRPWTGPDLRRGASGSAARPPSSRSRRGWRGRWRRCQRKRPSAHAARHARMPAMAKWTDQGPPRPDRPHDRDHGGQQRPRAALRRGARRQGARVLMACRNAAEGGGRPGRRWRPGPPAPSPRWCRSTSPTSTRWRPAPTASPARSTTSTC